jgi:hypothetical protein
MNLASPIRLPLSEPVDFLLADVAIRVQLSATDHGRAVDRYETVNNWIERPGSPLEDRVQIFYPQGSMAIGATIASKLEYDEFDIDLIAQLDLPAGTPPHEVLSILEAAIRGEPGSRYHDKVERCTRCIQIKYADGMHLDVTPMVRLSELVDRTGFIFHAKDRRATVDDRSIIANPWGFADWFKERTPAERRFALAFSERAAAYDAAIVMDKADVEPVPEHCPAQEKSMAVIALQLLKRWRNVQYDQRDGRCPPSVVLANFVASNANQTQTLFEELLHQARQLRLAFGNAQNNRVLLEVRNPTCHSDVFTDRWPGSLHAQGVFVQDLNTLVRKLEQLQDERTLAEMQEILSELFGERPTLEAFKALNRRNGQAIVDGLSRHVPGSGRFEAPVLTAAVTAAAPSAAIASRATPRHTHFGGDLP